MNRNSVRPPQRIRCEAQVEWLFFFTTYLTGRARLARRHRVTAAATWTTSERISTARISQSSPL